jgi:hypothetical protein
MFKPFDKLKIGAVAIALLCACWLVLHQLAAPMRHHVEERPVVTVWTPLPSDIEEMTVELAHQNPRERLVGPFTVPEQDFQQVCSFFSGTKWKDTTGRTKRLPTSAERDVWTAGRIHMRLKTGKNFDITYYPAGKGAICFSIQDNYYIAETGDMDGEYSLSRVLAQAKKN